jgi:hypothetical protein
MDELIRKLAKLEGWLMSWEEEEIERWRTSPDASGEGSGV